jgi:hypothetical protein
LIAQFVKQSARYPKRLYFMKLRRLTQRALDAGEISAELERERAKRIPTFTHYLDLPMLFLIIALGVLKPATWAVFFYGSSIAIAVATPFTVMVPRIYPWKESDAE